MKKGNNPLGELENSIMAVVWKQSQATVREVHTVLCKKRELAYTTVMTVMSRLTEKGILCRKEQGDGSFIYRPCQTKEEFDAKVSRNLAGELLRHFGPVAVAQFVDVLEEFDPKQLALLRERLESKKIAQI